MTDAGRIPRQDQARALADPTRYEIHRYVADAGRDVGVAELTEHTGLNHNAVRQHLAKLVAAGLVVVEPEQQRRRGRPRLVYRPAKPDRVGDDYERLAVWLTEVVATGATPVEVGRRAGARTTAPLEAGAGTAVEHMRTAMEVHGFAPTVRRREGGAEIVLGRCPFGAAVLADQETVCGLHRGLAEGAAAGIGGLRVDELVPHDPRRAGCRLLLSEAR